MLRDTIVDPEYYRQRGDSFSVNQLGFSYSLLRDRALSPLRYEGGGLGWVRNRYRFKPQAMIRQQLAVSSLVLANEQTERVLGQISLEYSWARHAPIELRYDKLKLYVGGFAGGLVNVKTLAENTNNTFSYELAVLLGPSAVGQVPIRILGWDMVLTNELHFPLLSLLANTPYAWPTPTVFEEGGRLGDALTVGSWGTFFRATNQVSLDFHYAKRRQGRTVRKIPYRLAYRWEFVSVADANLYQAGVHTFSIARIVAK